MSALAGEGFKRVEKIVAQYEGELDTTIQIRSDEFSARQKKVQAALKDRDLDVGIFFWYREMPGDGVYLTGYNPTIERASGLIGQQGAPLAIGGPGAGMVAREVAARSGVG
ncbi:MAG: hypothetical protein QGD94_09040, partial [Planctomycetia bacterium]|nr:hypothetical protein [Planctomycetia bacterium]